MLKRAGFRIAWLILAVAILALPLAIVEADGTIDWRGNMIRARVTGKPDLYNPGDWSMRLEVFAINAVGQPIADAPITLERSCRGNLPCPFKNRPEGIGTTDVTGRLVYTWTEHKVPLHQPQSVEGAVHVYIPPEWVSLDLQYILGTGGATDGDGGG